MSHSEETKLLLRELNLGENNPMYGKKHTEEWKKQHSEALKGRHHTEETKLKISIGNKGKIISEEAKRKVGDANRGEKGYWFGKTGEQHPMYGKKASAETRKKLSETLLGNKRTLGYKHRPESIEKIRQASLNLTKGQREKISKANSGEGNANWRGGLSFQPYGKNWTQRLKRLIRERDKYTCQICKKENSNVVHHIDYNKENCSQNNLITLCKVCNSVVNFNREDWTNYFNKVYLY